MPNPFVQISRSSTVTTLVALMALGLPADCLAQIQIEEPFLRPLEPGHLVANAVALSAFAITCCIAYMSLPPRRFQERVQLTAERFLVTAIADPTEFLTRWCPKFEADMLDHHLALACYLKIAGIVDWNDHGLTSFAMKSAKLKISVPLFCKGYDNLIVFVAATMSYVTLICSFIFLYFSLNILHLPKLLQEHPTQLIVLIYTANLVVMLLLTALALTRVVLFHRVYTRIRWARDQLRKQMRDDFNRQFATIWQ